MSGNQQSGSSSGPLRTTLEVDRLLVQQIYVRTANNTPISSGYVLLADGQGGTRFGPAAIQADYFSLSSMISAGTAKFSDTLSTSFGYDVYSINYAFSNLEGNVLSTFFTIGLGQDTIGQKIIDLSNLIINISTYSTFVGTANLSFSTLSSYINTITLNYVTNATTTNSNSTLLGLFTSTTGSFSNNLSTLENKSFTIFNNYSTFQSQLYLNNFSTISSQYHYLLLQSFTNYSTLSTTLANQQSSYNLTLSTVMSSYIINYSTILGIEVNLLGQYQYSLTQSVSSLSSLIFSVATQSLNSELTALNSTVSSSVYRNINSLSGQLSTIQGTSLTSLGSSLSTTTSLASTLNSLSTSLQITYSSLTIELSITQTRGINSQLYNQFFQLGITQSSILANNQSSINYLSTVIGRNYSTATIQFSTLANTNYSTLLGIGYSSIVIANNQIYLSTSYLLQSTLTSTNIFLVNSSNLQSTNLGKILSTSYSENLSTISGNINTIVTQTSTTSNQLYTSLSTFSTFVYSYIGDICNSISTQSFIPFSTLSNWTISSVSNNLSTNLGLISNTLTSVQVGTINPQVAELSNSLVGLISTSFSSLSSFSKTFAGLSTVNVFTNNQIFQGPIVANSGIYTQFFQISNVISTYTYKYTGKTQYYKPNRFANQVLVQLWGAGGSAGINTNGGGGSYVEGIFSVDSTQIYNINIGQGGIFSTIKYNAINGGGSGMPPFTGGGGGATNIYLGTDGSILSCNIAIAGGGGGGGLVSTFNDWNAIDIVNKTIVTYNLNNSFSSNQFLGPSTFSSYQTITGLTVNYLFSSLSTYLSYNLSTTSTVYYNFSTLSTNFASENTPANQVIVANYSTFNMSTFSTIAFNYSTLSTNVLSPFLIFNLSTTSTVLYNFSTLSTNAASVNTPASQVIVANYSTFNMSTFSTIAFNYSTLSTKFNYLYTSSFISTNTAFLNSSIVSLINSTIYLPIGSWGGAGGITYGITGTSPYSTISSSDFSLTGQGGTQIFVEFPILQSNVITRNSAIPPIFSTIIRQSTFTNYVGDFIPQLMGYSPYTYSSLSTSLSSISNNSSNYTIVSTNIYQDTLFSNYFSTVINLLPNNSSTLAFYYTVRDLYSLQNVYAPNSLPLVGLTQGIDYTTDKTPTAIYSADLEFTLTNLGSPYGIAVHLTPYPFDVPDPLLFSSAIRYISSMMSTIQNTTSVTNVTGLKYYNRVGTNNIYNGTFVTEGIYGSLLDRYIFTYMSTISRYNYSIYTPSTIRLEGNTFSTTGWLLSSIVNQSNYNVNTSSIVSSIYREIYAGCNRINVPPTFAPYVYDSFFPFVAQSTLTSYVTPGGFVINYSTVGDFFTQWFETSTIVKSERKMYNIFISSAGANGLSLINTLPITISSLTRNTTISTATTFGTYNLPTYISNYFNSQDYTNQNFTINDIKFTIKTIADFPTVKLYIQTISTIQYVQFASPSPVTTSNVVYFGPMGTIFQGANAISTVFNTITQSYFTGVGGGGGGGGLYGGEAGAFTAGNATYQQYKYFIGGGGGGGGSSYISPLTGISNSLPGQTINSGFNTHPKALELKAGQGGIDYNSFNNLLLYSTFSTYTSTMLSKSGGNGLVILTEYIDPFRITISNATQNFTPLRIDATTNEVVVNKIVISSPQVFILGPNNPSTCWLDFGNYQQFYITLRDHVVSSFHLIPLSTISSASMNFQTGCIYLNISTVSTSALIDLSSFRIENGWQGNSPGVLSTYANTNTYLFEYSLFNSNVYLTNPRMW
jgi:hypothetical protein